MGNQIPLIIALLMLACAAGLGYYQKEEAVAAAAPKELIRRPPTRAKSAQTEKSVTTPATPSTPTARPTRRVAPSTEGTAPVAAPTPEPAPAPVPAPAPATATQPAIRPRVGGGGKFQTLLDLQDDLKKRTQLMPMGLANGGYRFDMAGAHLEVITTPSWSITIYNINPKDTTETQDFKMLMEIVTAQLAINTNQKPVETATGKTFLQTASKLGRISLERDPEMGNSCKIRPVIPTPAVDTAAQTAAPKPQAQPVNPNPEPAKTAVPAADF
jgi:hypothetical protein